MAFIRSISGIRATLGDGLVPSELAKYIAAFLNIMPNGKIVIGNDGRPSATWITDLAVSICKSMNREAIDIGLATTPTVQLISEIDGCVGGIAITASHNPGNWNGLKFIGANGIFLDADENQKLWELVDNNQVIFPNEYKYSEIDFYKEANSYHINYILKSNLISNKKVLESIKDKNYSAVVDAVNASGSYVVPNLLDKLNVKCHRLYCEGNGSFPHPPEPIPEHLGELANAVKEKNADLGIAVDPDGDRLVLIDEHGVAIGEEKTIALCVKYVLSKKDIIPGENAIVVNLSTSMMSEIIAKEYGAKIYYSKVGEINVVKKMKEINACFGGEGSGGVILPIVHYGRDSLVGIGIILSLMANEGKTLSQLAADLPSLTMIKTKKEFSGDLAPLLEKFEAEFTDYNDLDKQDGLKFKFENSWLQIRSSNTEPIIRIMAEAKTEEEANSLIERAKELI